MRPSVVCGYHTFLRADLIIRFLFFRPACVVGVVQALLLTKHVLFVGFSLQDDNFHR